jgi:hypothetical protein
VDEYSKSGPKTPKAASEARRREMEVQMRDLLAINDEATLVSEQVRSNPERSALHGDYADLE